MKKILCLIDTLGFGGAERQMMGLVSYLKERGYDTTLANYIEHDLHSYVEERYGYSTITLRCGSNMLSKLYAVWKHIHKKKYDTIIAYKDGTTSLTCILKLLGCDFKLIVSERNTTQSLTLREKIKFWLYRFADYIVPNAYSQEIFIKNKFPKLQDKIVTITNFTDIDYFKPGRDEKHNGIEILIVARVSPQKNVLRFLEGIKIVKDTGTNVHFKWFGDVRPGLEEYASQCDNKIKELHIDDMISFFPATKNVLEEYQKCDVFCLPSIYEGYPNVICEAMSCGKPIICSNVCDNPYIVKDGENSFVFNPNSSEDIAEKILLISSLSKEEIKKKGMKSRQISEDLFSKETFVNKYVKIIES